MLEYSSYALWAFAAGAGIPIMMALNSHLGKGLQNPAVAVMVLFTAGFLTALAYAIATRAGVPDAATFGAIPKKYYLGGALMCFYGISVTIMAPKFGVGNCVLFVVCAQVCVSAVIDAWGLFGAPVKPLDPVRIIGLFVVCGGLVLTQLGPVLVGRK